MRIVCFYDYTCRYSYLAYRWLQRVITIEPSLAVRWRTLSLKELNRGPREPSPLKDRRTESVSVLALALAHAARSADFEGYHRDVFNAMHGARLEPEGLYALAARRGVDVEAFRRRRAHWLRAVAQDHGEAIGRWQAVGTPTLVLGRTAVFLRLGHAPRTAGAAVSLWESVRVLAAGPARLVEIHRPGA